MLVLSSLQIRKFREKKNEKPPISPRGFSCTKYGSSILLVPEKNLNDLKNSEKSAEKIECKIISEYPVTATAMIIIIMFHMNEMEIISISIFLIS